MRQCGGLRAILICNLTAWATIVPWGWLHCHQCEHCDSLASGSSAAQPSWSARATLLEPWAIEVLRAVEQQLHDAAGKASIDTEVAIDAAPTLAKEVSNFVAARVAELGDRALHSSAKKNHFLSDAGSQATLVKGQAAPVSAAPNVSAKTHEAARCQADRGYVPTHPTATLVLPVLDPLGGKVKGGPHLDAAGGQLAEALFPANQWGVPMPNITVEVAPNKILTLDEIVYGYDLLFEAMHLFSYVSWGRVPMQQDPADALAIADLLGRLQPDCFVELGTNTGGGAIFYADVMRGYREKPLVVTIDVHEPTINWDRFATKACPHCVPVTCHPTWNEPGLIKFVKGYSQEPRVIEEVERLLSERQCQRTVVMHDSDHRRATVVQDLGIYHRFVSQNSYLIVQDTKLSRMRGGRYSTLEAVNEFLESPEGRGRFVIDKTFEYMLFSHHHNGFLQRVRSSK